ncbi:hypothetical protein [Phaffia rhodozyma]|uniref:Uncharacterized protein n=1 Tax=Phaffia rhodozyma TaxID=264483 RepID=A0A0F7SWZ2_PHARH|nr:hypothetical protein [Phaffia rhodozyma]
MSSATHSFDGAFDLRKVMKVMKPVNAALFVVWVGTCYVATAAENRKLNETRAKYDLPPQAPPKSFFTFAKWNPDAKE